MPPRGWRGGRGRGGSRLAKAATARSNYHRGTRRHLPARINGHSIDQNDANGVHALLEPPGLLIIAGLSPQHFPDYDSAREDDDQDGESDSHSDYGSATAKTPRKTRTTNDSAGAADTMMQHAERASNPGNDGDWTETDVEVFVAPKTRGFYRPPPKREVVRKRVKKVESSRYNDAVQKVRQASPVDDAAVYGEFLSRRSSQKSNQTNEDLPIIVEQEATEDEAEEKEASKTVTRGPGRRGGRRKKTPTPEVPRPEIIQEGELSDSNFPDAFLQKPPVPHIRHCEDKADWIMRKRFAPMGDPQAFITALTKIDPAARSTEVLYDIALNAQRAIRAWQDEYLKLDLITAPRSNPPKKPLTGGRITIDPLIYEDMLEADLYGYNYDAKKLPGQQDPFRQRAGGGKFVGGRELRQRRGRDVGAVDLSEPEATNTEGYGTRRRRAAQRQNEAQLQVPSLRGVKRTNSYGPSDYDGPPRKRGRPSAADRSATQARIQQLREESLAMTNNSELDGQSPEPSRRRGRPPGSRNTMPRSDAGIKKGPRKSRLTSAAADSEGASQAGFANTETPASTQDPMDLDEVPSNGAYARPGHVAAESQAGAVNGTASGTPNDRGSASTGTPIPAADTKDPKKRVRSEKRSKSMTEWWAARKAKAAEDRKAQLAAQAEADRVAEEQARAAHAAHQAQYPPQDVRFWPQIAPQHQQHPQPQYPGPLTHLPHMAFTGPQPSKDRMRLPPRVSQPPSRGLEYTQDLPPPASRAELQYAPPLPPIGRPQGPLPSLAHPPSQQLPPPLPPPPLHTQPQHPPPQVAPLNPQPSLPSASLSNAPPLPPPSLQQAPPQQHAPPVPIAGSPPQAAQQHVFHHHPAPPPPPTPLQFSPPPQVSGQNRQPSPLRRIINYVSDPSKAAQPAGPPYQTIMTPGANASPNIIQHHTGNNNRPSSRGVTPPATSTPAPTPAPAPAPPAGSLMSAFHVNNSAGRHPIPGTGSFRPDTPGKSTFTQYTIYTPPSGSRSAGPQGRMTGAQVQDLHLAAVQPLQRKPIEDVLKEQQRDWKARSNDATPPGILPPQPQPLAPGSRNSGFFKIQPAPQQSLPPLSGASSDRDRPSSRSSQPPPPSNPVGPSSALQALLGRPPSQSGQQSPSAHPFGIPRQTLPPLLGFDRDARFREREVQGANKSMSPLPGPTALARDGSRHRSLSNGSGGLGQPFRIVPLTGEKGKDDTARRE